MQQYGSMKANQAQAVLWHASPAASAKKGVPRDAFLISIWAGLALHCFRNFSGEIFHHFLDAFPHFKAHKSGDLNASFFRRRSCENNEGLTQPRPKLKRRPLGRLFLYASFYTLQPGSACRGAAGVATWQSVLAWRLGYADVFIFKFSCCF